MGTQQERTASGYVARCDPAQGGIRSSFVDPERAYMDPTNRRLIARSLAQVFSWDENFERYEPNLDQFEFFELRLNLLLRDSSNATLSVDKDNSNPRASFRGNRHDLCMLMYSVGGYAHTCVGDLNDRRGVGRNDDL